MPSIYITFFDCKSGTLTSSENLSSVRNPAFILKGNGSVVLLQIQQYPRMPQMLELMGNLHMPTAALTALHGLHCTPIQQSNEFCYSLHAIVLVLSDACIAKFVDKTVEYCPLASGKAMPGETTMIETHCKLRPNAYAQRTLLMYPLRVKFHNPCPTALERFIQAGGFTTAAATVVMKRWLLDLTCTQGKDAQVQ